MYAGFKDKLEMNGREIFSVFEEMVREGGFALEPTDNGYHFCVVKGTKSIRFIQIWPAPRDWLETRMQYIEREIIIPLGTKHSIQSLLKDINFERTSGGKGNMRLVFGRQRGRDITGANLKKMRDNLRLISEIIKGCEAR